MIEDALPFSSARWRAADAAAIIGWSAALLVCLFERGEQPPTATRGLLLAALGAAIVCSFLAAASSAIHEQPPRSDQPIDINPTPVPKRQHGTPTVSGIVGMCLLITLAYLATHFVRASFASVAARRLGTSLSVSAIATAVYLAAARMPHVHERWFPVTLAATRLRRRLSVVVLAFAALWALLAWRLANAPSLLLAGASGFVLVGMLAQRWQPATRLVSSSSWWVRLSGAVLLLGWASMLLLCALRFPWL